MTLAAFNGHEAFDFPDYLDLGTGKTLHAEPGGTYDVAPASGRNVPDMPAGWFTPVARPGVGAWIGVSRELTGEDEAADATGSDSGEPAYDEDDHSAF